MAIELIAPAAMVQDLPLLNHIGSADAAAASSKAASGVDGGTSFSDMLLSKIADVENKVTHADQMARNFAIDDSIPVHQVTFAMEEARLSLELMMQVRSRMVEGFREIMNMQL